MITNTKENTSFTKLQFDAIYPKNIEYHYWTKVRNRIITRIVKKYGEKGGILEIGCGRGIVVNYLNEHGLDCCGVELADVQIPASLQDKILANTDVNDLPSDYCDRFTVFLLLDVIEHIADPVSFLRNLTVRFKNLRTIVITVPAAPELFSNYDEFNDHYRRYDWQMLKNLATEVGIELRYQSYLFHALYWPARFTLWLHGKRKVNVTAPRNMISRGIHEIIAQMLFLDMLLLPKKLKGTSLIAVYKI